MPFSALIGNERIKTLLKRAVAEERLAQSFIFAGPPGIGKRGFALALAEAVNCHNLAAGDSCGQCISCLRIAAGEHLDVVSSEPDGQFIKIGQMRDLLAEAQFTPYEGRRRIFIVDDADRLRIEASNSILKTLEEPAATTLILLITSRPYALLDTIRSRCQMLSFGPLGAAEIEEYLDATSDRSTEETRLLARLCQGSLAKALKIELEPYKERRETLIQLVRDALTTRDAARLVAAAERLGRKLEREETENEIDALIVLLWDLFRLKVGQTADQLINADIGPALGALGRPLRLEQIIGFVEKLEQFRLDLTRNINRQVALEAMLLSP